MRKRKRAGDDEQAIEEGEEKKKKRKVAQKPLETHACIRVPMKSFLSCGEKDNEKNEFMEKLHDACERNHRIVSLMYQLYNLHIRRFLEQKKDIPEIKHNDLCQLLNACSRLENREEKNFKMDDELRNTYIKEWKRLMKETNREYHQLPYRDGILTSIKNYSIVRMETAIKNNIWMHFHKRHVKYLRLVLPLSKQIPRHQQKKFYVALQNAILDCDNKMQDFKEFSLVESQMIQQSSTVNQWFETQYALFPTRANNMSFEDHLKQNPHLYLRAMWTMLKKCEECGVKGFALLPQQHSFVTGSITLNTATLKSIASCANLPVKGDSDEFIWNYVFGTKLLETKNKKFKYLLDTDGVSCSFHMHKPALSGKKKSEKNQRSNTCFLKDDEMRSKGMFDLPIFTNSEKRKAWVKEHESKFVGVDPGLHNLLYVTKAKHEKKECLTYSFTRGFRDHQLLTKKYQRKKEKWKQSDEKLMEMERQLSQSNSTCSSVNDYLAYLKLRWKFETPLFEFYSKQVYRKFRMDSFIKKQQSESQLCRNLKERFGNDVILCMGDWSKDQTRHFRGLAPMPQVGLRRRLARDFLVLNTRESYSSKLCPCCEKWLSVVKRKGDPPWKKKRKQKERLELKNVEAKDHEIRGLRKCDNTDCGIWWNRDRVGAVNILKNALSYINSREYRLQKMAKSLLNSNNSHHSAVMIP